MAQKYRVGVIGHTGRGNYGHGLDRVWLSIAQCEIVGVADAEIGGRDVVVNAMRVFENLKVRHG